MSNSRLEKFIYAICGMEVDDLPTPLSRIETLWNCLITGETPDFEPLSRNEKYLMSMLTGDVDALPEPTSRGEKLLYKIATGETDLSDVPGYLSRYEELLKQLIENGGIGGTDFEYVLYTLNDSFSTLYTTAEGPVKSAILSGQTLVNLLETKKEKYTFNNQQNWVVEDGYLKCNGTSSWHTVTDKFNDMIKPSTKYLLRIEIVENTLDMILNFDGYGTNIPQSSAFLAFAVNEVGVKSHIVTTAPELDSTKNGLFRLPINITNGGTLKIRFMAIEYQDGMENWDTPYFEGMQSVKMPVLTTTGKNLFDVNKGKEFVYNRVPFTKFDGSVYTIRVDSVDSVEIENDSIILNNITYANTVQLQTKHYVDEGVTYNISIINESGTSIRVRGITYYNQYGEILGGYWDRIGEITPPKGCNYLIVGYTCGLGNGRYKIQFEQGSTATTYEPYKSNILTTTSKNLFNMNRPYDNLTDSQATVVQDTNQITVSSSAESGIYVNANFILDKDFFAGKTVTGSCLYESDENDIGTVQIVYQDGDGEYHYQWIRTPKTFTFPNSFIGDVMLSVSANNTDTPQSNTVTVKNIQLELGSTATPYEPYSEVTLRGIGDVKDTLDGNTGELTQRIGEVVLDGSERWVYEPTYTNDNVYGCYIGFEQLPQKPKPGNFNFANNMFPNITNNSYSQEGFATNPAVLSLRINKNKLDSSDVSGFKKYLQNHPVTLQYPLATESIKTVGLFITDQDGQSTKLKTFNDVTHVSIEAEDLLPTVDLEVPTKIEATLSTLPTLMNDISETQQLLNESIDDQAKNIKEVSTAITEIRNDIL